MHLTSEPAILYFGTPVVVISTVNEDGSANLAPMSSAFWLGWRCVLGLGAMSQTARNLRRDGQCVLNLPSQAEVSQVNRLALTTGAEPVPSPKAARGYRHVKDLAPTTELRRLQYREDDRQGVGKRNRIALAPGYVERYTREILDPFDLGALVAEFPGDSATALFCVERDPEACHRSLVAERLAFEYDLPVVHLRP